MEAFAAINADIKKAQIGQTGEALGSDFMTHVFPVFKKKADELMKVYEVKSQEANKLADKLYQEAQELRTKAHEIDNSPLCQVGSTEYHEIDCLVAWARNMKEAERKDQEANKAWEEASAIYDQANSLQQLEITPQQAPYVRYLSDKEGFVLPRFGVRLQRFYFKRELIDQWDLYDQQTGQYVKQKSCSMYVEHSTSYAGLAQSYHWPFNYERPQSASVWTYDENANTVEIKGKYNTDQDGDGEVDYNLLDMNEVFKPFN